MHETIKLRCALIDLMCALILLFIVLFNLNDARINFIHARINAIDAVLIKILIDLLYSIDVRINILEKLCALINMEISLIVLQCSCVGN